MRAAETPTETPPRRVRRRPWDNTTSCVVLAAVVTLMISAFVPRLPKTVDRLTVSNPSEFNVLVEVSDGDARGWTAASTARHDGENVIDQGDAWTLRFTIGSIAGDPVPLSRDELVSSGWYVEVPQAVIDHARNAGVAPAGSAS
jgi:hypothetical protein